MTIENTSYRWYLKAVQECPQRREPYFYLAKWHYQNHRHADAAAWMLLAAERTDPGVYTTRAEAWGKQFDQLKKKIMGRVKQ